MRPDHYHYLIRSMATMTGLLLAWALWELHGTGTTDSAAFQTPWNLFVATGILTFALRGAKPSRTRGAPKAATKKPPHEGHAPTGGLSQQLHALRDTPPDAPASARPAPFRPAAEALVPEGLGATVPIGILHGEAADAVFAALAPRIHIRPVEAFTTRTLDLWAGQGIRVARRVETVEDDEGGAAAGHGRWSSRIDAMDPALVLAGGGASAHL